MKTKKITLGQTLIAIVGMALIAFIIVNTDINSSENSIANFEEFVLPIDGIVLPIQWNDLGKQMVEVGVIDKEKFEALYANRGGLNSEDIKLLYGEDNENIVMNKENSAILLNILWAFGLSNKNKILEEGPMVDEKYGGNAGNFASTGGWGLSVGDAMNHYSKYSFVTLTENQQKLVVDISKNIYRPCCGNSTHFPDCNHGMAMLGLLELLASQDISEKEIYDIALQVNSYWFPDTYLTLAEYFEGRGTGWDKINSKEILGSTYSSGQGYSKILKKMKPTKIRGGAGCSV
ncbi:MAG: hypothetical protein AAB475_01295 [Patescibacteria group bacterium]